MGVAKLKWDQCQLSTARARARLSTPSGGRWDAKSPRALAAYVKLTWPAFQGKPPAGKAKELDGLKPGKSTFLAATFTDLAVRYGAGSRPVFDPVAGSSVAAATGVFTRYHDALDKVQKKYDWDANRGEWYEPSIGLPSKGSEQVRWESYIQRALIDERCPAVVAPDGATYKQRLMDIARAGIIARNETRPF